MKPRTACGIGAPVFLCFRAQFLIRSLYTADSDVMSGFSTVSGDSSHRMDPGKRTVAPRVTRGPPSSAMARTARQPTTPPWPPCSATTAPSPACKAHGAKTKGKVERPFRYVRQDFFLARRFRDLDGLPISIGTARSPRRA